MVCLVVKKKAVLFAGHHLQKSMRKFTVLALSLLTYTGLFSQSCFQKNRYREPIFDSIVITPNVTYAIAPQLVPTEVLGIKTYDETKFEDVELKMDIYEPFDDTLSRRPMIIFMHSGGFLPDYGDRHNDDMIAFCDTFARKGYVTATISYRLGYDILDSVAATRAVYRAIQDGRSAIRFLKEKATTYRIDTNNIFMLGSSAGAFIALHNAYLNEESERPIETYEDDDHPDLGALDATGNDYRHVAQAQGIVSLWGALQDTALILSDDVRPTLLVHGIDDESVYFEYDHPFGLSTLPKVYGSHPVYKKLNQLGYDAPHYFVSGEDHEFYGIDGGKWENDTPNAYWDTILLATTNFIYEQLPKPTAVFSYDSGCPVYFNNESDGLISSCWDFGDNSFSAEFQPSHTYVTSDTFLVSLSVINYLGIIDNQEQNIYFPKCEANAVSSSDFGKSFQIYPNPTSEILHIDFLYEKNRQLTVFDITGRVILKSFETHTHVKLNVSSLKAGVYFISVANGSSADTFKFIKK
jgi:hypothetical protein